MGGAMAYRGAETVWSGCRLKPLESTWEESSSPDVLCRNGQWDVMGNRQEGHVSPGPGNTWGAVWLLSRTQRADVVALLCVPR